MRRLAILTPRWAAVSETFIRLHLTAIAPGRTVAMARDVLSLSWCPELPLLPIRDVKVTALEEVVRRLGFWQMNRRSRELQKFLNTHNVTVVMSEWLDFFRKVVSRRESDEAALFCPRARL
jgi:hypothetical protein